MSKGFFTLKDKIQYLFQKIDTGEHMLPVELDLLKAYTQNLVDEIATNEEELLDTLNKKAEEKQSEPKEIKPEAEKTEAPFEQDQEASNQKTFIDPQIDQPVDASVEAEPDPVAEMDEEELKEISEEIQKETDSSSETEKAPAEETSSLENVTFDPEFEIEEQENDGKDQALVEEDATHESLVEKPEALPEEEETAQEEPAPEEDASTNEEAKQPEAPISEETLENKDVPQPEPEIATEEDKEVDSTTIQDQISAVKEDETDEDYGIGLKFKKAKPLGELIDLSEKYIFIQGLFDQDPDRFTKALRKMDEASGVSEALDILSEYVVEGPDKSQNAELLQKLKAYLRIRFA